MWDYAAWNDKGMPFSDLTTGRGIIIWVFIDREEGWLADSGGRRLPFLSTKTRKHPCSGPRLAKRRTFAATRRWKNCPLPCGIIPRPLRARR